MQRFCISLPADCRNVPLSAKGDELLQYKKRNEMFTDAIELLCGEFQFTVHCVLVCSGKVYVGKNGAPEGAQEELEAALTRFGLGTMEEELTTLQTDAPDEHTPEEQHPDPQA